MPDFQDGEIIEFKDELYVDDDDLQDRLKFLRGLISRRYQVVDKAGDGGKGVGFKCVLLDNADNPLLDDHDEPLYFFVKIPKEGGQYKHQERVRYMNTLKEAAINERLTWAKLKDTPRLANVGFDRCVRDHNYGVPFPKTAQRYLSEGQTLNEKIRYASPQFHPPDERTFLHYALKLAEAVAGVHSRRVTHGDIHMGNIFVTTKEEAWRTDSQDIGEHFVLIDFGAAIFEQGNDGTVNVNHEFRAPERRPLGASYVISEAVDVYSFGKILYVLCTGLRDEAALIPDGVEDNRERRAYIRGKLQPLYSQNPCYLDIIASCCSYDPINRPSMSQIVAYLNRLINTGIFVSGPAVPKVKALNASIDDMKRRSKKLFQELDPVTKDLFEMMAREKVEEIMDMFSDEPTTQAVVRGTRWEVINSLAMLFDHMKEGDSWTTMTTPEVWQGKGLGLDGRYMSSNILALKRGASIRRFMGLSVDQLGLTWSRGLAEILNDSKSDDLKLLGSRLSEAVGNIRVRYEQNISDHYYRTYRRMVYDYLRAWRDGITVHKLYPSFVSNSLFSYNKGLALPSYSEATGLHMSLIIFEDIDCLRESKKVNALSLLILGGQPFSVVTEMHGRIPRHGGQQSEKEPAIPSLVGFRLFKSLLPDMTEERKIRFFDLVHRNQGHEWRGAVNIGPHLHELCEAVESKLEL